MLYFWGPVSRIKAEKRIFHFLFLKNTNSYKISDISFIFYLSVIKINLVKYQQYRQGFNILKTRKLMYAYGCKVFDFFRNNWFKRSRLNNLFKIKSN
jgi:hypothetical protein